MRIVDLIEEALKPLGIPTYFISRGDYKSSCIVYNYIATPGKFADNKACSTKYTILLNVVVDSKVEKRKYDIIKAMTERGFVKTNLQSTKLEENGFYNTPIQFKINLLEN